MVIKLTAAAVTGGRRPPRSGRIAELENNESVKEKMIWINTTLEKLDRWVSTWKMEKKGEAGHTLDEQSLFRDDDGIIYLNQYIKDKAPARPTISARNLNAIVAHGAHRREVMVQDGARAKAVRAPRPSPA
jgi:hypothetical protein